MILREPSSGTRETLASALQSHRITLDRCNIVLEVSGNEALKSAVLSQLGVAFISRWAVKKELDAGNLVAISIPGLEIKRQFYALSKAPLLPTCVKNLWDFLLASTILEAGG
jgi:DNA-binding transcriptional LysR family regulator